MIFNRQQTFNPGEKRARRRSALPAISAASAVTAMLLATALAHPAAAQSPIGPGNAPGEWPFWGADLGNTHAGLGERSIDTANAHLLQQKWVFQTAGDVSATPTVSEGSVYVPDWGGFLYRINASTGAAVWTHKVSDYTGNAKSLSRNAPAIGPQQIVFGDQATGSLMAVDKGTGALLWKTTLDTAAGTAITNSPVIANGRVYVGVSSTQESLALQPGFQLTFRGSVVALDLASGKILWQTYTVPQGYTGGAVWGSNFIVDGRRQALFVTTGNNYTVPPAVATCVAGAGTDAAAKLACLDPNDFLDAVLSLDLKTGAIKWGHRLEGADTWTVSCIVSGTGGVPCPDPSGPDYDFGSGPNLIQTQTNGRSMEAIGAGQKSGVYWALNPDTGAVLWGTQVGPGGDLGGMEWGSATENGRVYTEIGNAGGASYLLQPAKTQSWNGGSWAALDGATGNVLWQVPATGQNPLNPSKPASALGQVTVANGVFYAGSMSGDMVALNAATGDLLWKFASGGSVISGPSIVDGTLYWGSGYHNFGLGTANNKLYAFALPAGSGAPSNANPHPHPSR